MRKVLFICCLWISGMAYIACESKDIAYEQNYIIEKSVMTGTNPLVYKFENNADTFQLYDVCVSINHVMNFESVRIPVELSYYSPKGDSISIPIAISVYDDDFKALGEIQKDSSITLTQTIFYANRIMSGVNTFKITPANNTDSLYGINSVTLSIEKVN